MNRIHRRHERRFKLWSRIALAAIAAWLAWSLALGDGACDGIAASSLIIAGLSCHANGVFRRWDYCVIHPYFERTLPQPGARTLFIGRQLARELDAIDAWLARSGARTLSSFGYRDSYRNERNDWFSAGDGIRVIDRIVASAMAMAISDAARSELAQVREALVLAQGAGIRFCLHMRHRDGAAQGEFDQREGSYA